ncbi:cell division protein ZapB [Alteromonas sp. ASW11-19]|uniref:Cell division protein ZapB n=1 Tax=Alteromonas salexigens TaxID=2982530 RepID=A0ABT2VQN4_9ALTE|nr:cell division protein ZapB [Alteromonas salexigens]MCU7555435.1 cell division protein ZapB [Alteromonas salexigens]
MTPEALKARLGTYRLSLLVMVALIAMAVFGYQLADFQKQGTQSRVPAMKRTITLLKDENAALQTRVNQLEVALNLAEQEAQSGRQLQQEHLQTIAELQTQLGFYQNVMAPETTQDGFFIDGIQAIANASDDQFTLRFVLLQQRDNRAIVKGNLEVAIVGSQDGEPVTLTAGSEQFLPEGPIKYRFKYFQTVNVKFTLPTGFVPESVRFDTYVYQYTTLRGRYQRTVPWEKVVAGESPAEDTP